MTPTHAISADEARRLLAEDRAEFEWRLRLNGQTNVIWKTREELDEIFRAEFSPGRIRVERFR